MLGRFWIYTTFPSSAQIFKSHRYHAHAVRVFAAICWPRRQSANQVMLFHISPQGGAQDV